jgi:hypothetical protein
VSDFIKAEKVVATALGLLLREVTLPQFVWRDAGGDFAGAKDDTISIRLPAYAPARTRALRSGAARTKDNLHERKVDVTLDTDVYKDIGISDEELTLDIAEFGTQVLNPVVIGVALQLEQELADVITGATYQATIAYTSGGDAYTEVVLPARARLNNAHVPAEGRVLLVGSDLESELLDHDRLIENVDGAGIMRNGVVGRLGGFSVAHSPAIPSDEAYAFHRTAFVLSQRAPIVPAGAPWGATRSFNGFAMRNVRVFDPNEVEDRFVTDAWVGANAVQDTGHFTGDPADGGQFVPVEDPANPINDTHAWEDDSARLIRAVKITVA